MRVVEVRDDGLAVCDGGIDVMTDLVGPVRPGDTLLVHAGTAIQLAERPQAGLGRRLDGARQGAEVPALPAPERRQ